MSTNAHTLIRTIAGSCRFAFRHTDASGAALGERTQSEEPRAAAPKAPETA